MLEVPGVRYYNCKCAEFGGGSKVGPNLKSRDVTAYDSSTIVPRNRFVDGVGH
jgi:hypothetical protein